MGRQTGTFFDCDLTDCPDTAFLSNDGYSVNVNDFNLPKGWLGIIRSAPPGSEKLLTFSSQKCLQEYAGGTKQIKAKAKL